MCLNGMSSTPCSQPRTSTPLSLYTVCVSLYDGRIPSNLVKTGPPGTGKTMTISCAASLWCQKGQPVWIVAQKNVGVKNIAETMLKRAVDFKLLVSLEFYDGWWVPHTSVVFKCLHYFVPVRHEHLYAGFSQHVVTVD